MTKRYYLTDWLADRNSLINWNLFADLFPDIVDSASTYFRNHHMGLYDVDGAQVIEFEVPGCGQDDLTLELENGKLNVTGKRTKPDSETRTFEYCYSVGDKYTIDDISAKVENGILTVTLKPSDSPARKQIEIK